MHRIAAPSLIVWGDADGVIAPDHAQDFAGRIADARVARSPEPAICRISSSPKRRRVLCGSFSVANRLQRKYRPTSKFDSMMCCVRDPVAGCVDKIKNQSRKGPRHGHNKV